LERGEWTKVFTFMFAHSGAGHLLPNLAALAVVTLLARDAKISGPAFLAVFTGIGFLAVVPALLVCNSSFVFLGASAGISALVGATSVKMVRSYGPEGLIAFIAFASAFAINFAAETSPTSAIELFVHLYALALGALAALGALGINPLHLFERRWTGREAEQGCKRLRKTLKGLDEGPRERKK